MILKSIIEPLQPDVEFEIIDRVSGCKYSVKF